MLVGINLLREGLDLPEVSLVAILDADKEGFLRSATSLIQTIGRAARNVDGQVIMYADQVTDSMRHAISETNRRRKTQLEYNAEHGIDPQTIRKKVTDILEMVRLRDGGDDAVAWRGARPGRGGRDARRVGGRSTCSDVPPEELGRLDPDAPGRDARGARQGPPLRGGGRLRDEINELEAASSAPSSSRSRTVRARTAAKPRRTCRSMTPSREPA